MQTALFSPCSTRSFGATPFARNSVSRSVMYWVGFCFVAIVAVSDMASLLLIDICWEGISILLLRVQRGKRSSALTASQARNRAVGILLGAHPACGPSSRGYP